MPLYVCNYVGEENSTFAGEWRRRNWDSLCRGGVSLRCKANPWSQAVAVVFFLSGATAIEAVTLLLLRLLHLLM